MGLTIVGTLLSILWLGACGWYVERTIGIDQLGLLMPNEMSQILSGIFLPIAFLWVLIAYIGLAIRVRALEEGASGRPRLRAATRSEPRVTRGPDLDQGDEDAVPALKIATNRDAG